jgi:hypothetical protein
MREEPWQAGGAHVTCMDVSPVAVAAADCTAVGTSSEAESAR